MTRAGPLIAALVLCASRPAFAYRPFDGTDAAVAERGQVEIELGPVGLLREGPDRFRVLPALIANAGFAERLELVLEGRHHLLLGAQAGAPRTRLVDTALSLKGVVRRGELQESSGPSVAMEVGVLLPAVNDEAGVGAQAALILSRRFSRARRPDLAQVRLARVRCWRARRAHGGAAPRRRPPRPRLRL